jgi:hypothetical protein
MCDLAYKFTNNPSIYDLSEFTVGKKEALPSFKKDFPLGFKI